QGKHDRDALLHCYAECVPQPTQATQAKASKPEVKRELFMASSSQELNQQLDAEHPGKDQGGAIVVHPSGAAHPLNEKKYSGHDDEYGEEAIATSRTSQQKPGLFTRLEA